MKDRFVKNYYFVSLLMVLFSLPVCAESFRVAKTVYVSIPNVLQDSEFETTVKMGMNDALAVRIPINNQQSDFPEISELMEGLEIKMTIPEDLAIWRDCCACTIYDNLSPAPSDLEIDYSGTKTYFAVLPGKLSWILQIPFSKDNNFRTNQYTTIIDSIPDLSTTEGHIFLRLQQIMKGLPDEVMNSQIKITIKPLLADKGLLKINILEPQSTETPSSAIFADFQPLDNEYNSKTQKQEGKEDFNSFNNINGDFIGKTSSLQENQAFLSNNLLVYVDEEPVSTDSLFKNKGFSILSSGIHNLTVISDNYRSEVRTVRIDSCKITELAVDLKSIEPTLIITAPEGTSIFFDERPLLDSALGKEFIISEGEHKVKFILGNYEIIRPIVATKGKTYRANLTLDLQLSEDSN